MKHKTIQVTQEDIDNGRKGSCRECPIARAMLRELSLDPAIGHVRVGDQDARWYHPGSGVFGYDRLMWSVPLPRSARRFVRKFDEYGPRTVKPFRFRLGVADHVEASK